jgi:HD-GYP domain-containing protein (c-di-GMP phosphodiesterase class II)
MDGHQTRSADLAHVIAVADVVESMASHRPYVTPLGLTAALEEINSITFSRWH